MQYKILIQPPEYHVGYGNDNEFIVVAKTLNKDRAEQIARLLTNDEPNWLHWCPTNQPQEIKLLSI